MGDKTRTLKQNRSLHKFCEMLATALNDGGFDMRLVLFGRIELEVIELADKLCHKHVEAFEAVFFKYHNKIDILWSRDSVKTCLWKPIQKAMFDTESTMDLDTAQVSKVYDVLSRYMAQKYGIDVDFPSDEPPII